jgi:hypothetical protein
MAKKKNNNKNDLNNNIKNISIHDNKGGSGNQGCSFSHGSRSGISSGSHSSSNDRGSGRY